MLSERQGPVLTESVGCLVHPWQSRCALRGARVVPDAIRLMQTTQGDIAKRSVDKGSAPVNLTQDKLRPDCREFPCTLLVGDPRGATACIDGDLWSLRDPVPGGRYPGPRRTCAVMLPGILPGGFLVQWR
jgi:hypothetical protein